MRHLNRRRFLTHTLALGCSAAANPFVTPMTFAAVPGEHRLVVVILRGAMDGLNVVAPLADPEFTAFRPKFDHSAHIDLDGYFALHPTLSDLLPMWQSGELAFAQAVATPYRNKRSHFEGQDLLEAGFNDLKTFKNTSRDGWLNRMLTLTPGATSQTAFAVGSGDFLILNGTAKNSSWSPDVRLDMSDQTRSLLMRLYEKDPLFSASAAQAFDLSDQLAAEIASGQGSNQGSNQGGKLPKTRDIRRSRSATLAGFAAGRLNQDSRIAVFSIGGWDTHKSQQRGITRPLKEISLALQVLKSTLGKNWQHTTILCMTEFGRTVRHNGSGGTDHGTGGAMVLAGGALKGQKVFGKWPGLGEGDLYQNRDLMPTMDVRSFAAWTLHHQFGISQSDLERAVFPGLSLDPDPGFIL